jgi:hypothetical protein
MIVTDNALASMTFVPGTWQAQLGLTTASLYTYLSFQNLKILHHWNMGISL